MVTTQKLLALEKAHPIGLVPPKGTGSTGLCKHAGGRPYNRTSRCVRRLPHMCRKARVRQSARKGPLDTEATLKWAGQGDLVLALELTLLYHTFPPTHQRRERREPPELANQFRGPFWFKIGAEPAQASRQCFEKLLLRFRPRPHCASSPKCAVLPLRLLPLFVLKLFFVQIIMVCKQEGVAN